MPRFESVEPVMGTLARIVVEAASPGEARAAFAAGFMRMRAIEAIFSDYQPGSEAMRLCRAPVQQPVKVSAELFTVLDFAQRLTRQSAGAFDVTVGPLTQLWRRGRKPTEAELLEARARTGYGNLVLDARERTVRLLWPGMRLDFGGIAKGYAADEALRAIGPRAALAAVSGDIAAGEGQWHVAIPMPPQSLTCSRCGISTSGDSEQSVEGYSHILDPHSGQGMRTPLTVTVQAPDAITADALATTLRVLGKARSREVLRYYPQAQAWFQ